MPYQRIYRCPDCNCEQTFNTDSEAAEANCKCLKTLDPKNIHKNQKFHTIGPTGILNSYIATEKASFTCIETVNLTLECSSLLVIKNGYVTKFFSLLSEAKRYQKTLQLKGPLTLDDLHLNKHIYTASKKHKTISHCKVLSDAYTTINNTPNFIKLKSYYGDNQTCNISNSLLDMGIIPNSYNDYKTFGTLKEAEEYRDSLSLRALQLSMIYDNIGLGIG